GGQPSRVASLRSSAEEPQPICQPAVSATPSLTRPATPRRLDPTQRSRNVRQPAVA
uniref:Uncharacterized protein n=1 Tax=Cucumis melo TaxID=3656 RepID=A0A9I9E3U9_CUCME